MKTHESENEIVAFSGMVSYKQQTYLAINENTVYDGFLKFVGK